MTDLKKELLRFKDIVDGMIEDGDILLMSPEHSDTYHYELLNKIESSKKGIIAILELAEELEKDND